MGEREVVDVSATVDQLPIGNFLVEIIALCAAVISIDGFDAQAIGYVAPALIKSWHVPAPEFGPVFGAGLFGIMLGALGLGSVADYIGRRRVIIWCTGLCAVFTLATILAHTIPQLIAIRFLTGCALGGAIPNLIALTAEYCPARSRNSLVVTMVCGISLGSAIGGTIAAALIPHYGWQSVFAMGGLIPLILTAVVIWRLPESIRFLALKRGSAKGIASILRRLSPAVSIPNDAEFVVAEETSASRFTVADLFRNGRALKTLLLWGMFFMNLLNLYFMQSWLPTVATGAGLSIQRAVIATAIFQGAGIVGTLIFARVLYRFHPCVALGTLYLGGGCFIALTGLTIWSANWILLTAFFAGLCIVGAQNGSNALAAEIYPTFIRSTGVGWALGIGRIGSIVGPLLGGLMLSLHWQPSTLFFAACLPAICAASAAFILQKFVGTKESDDKNARQVAFSEH